MDVALCFYWLGSLHVPNNFSTDYATWCHYRVWSQYFGCCHLFALGGFISWAAESERPRHRICGDDVFPRCFVFDPTRGGRCPRCDSFQLSRALHIRSAGQTDQRNSILYVTPFAPSTSDSQITRTARRFSWNRSLPPNTLHLVLDVFGHPDCPAADPWECAS